jgi:hypothetical protein
LLTWIIILGMLLIFCLTRIDSLLVYDSCWIETLKVWAIANEWSTYVLPMWCWLLNDCVQHINWMAHKKLLLIYYWMYILSNTQTRWFQVNGCVYWLMQRLGYTPCFEKNDDSICKCWFSSACRIKLSAWRNFNLILR